MTTRLPLLSLLSKMPMLARLQHKVGATRPSRAFTFHVQHSQVLSIMQSFTGSGEQVNDPLKQTFLPAKLSSPSSEHVSSSNEPISVRLTLCGKSSSGFTSLLLAQN